MLAWRPSESAVIGERTWTECTPERECIFVSPHVCSPKDCDAFGALGRRFAIHRCSQQQPPCTGRRPPDAPLVPPTATLAREEAKGVVFRATPCFLGEGLAWGTVSGASLPHIHSFVVCWSVKDPLCAGCFCKLWGVSVRLDGWGDALARGRSPLWSPSLCPHRHGFSVSASWSLCVLLYLSVLSLSRVWVGHRWCLWAGFGGDGTAVWSVGPRLWWESLSLPPVVALSGDPNHPSVPPLREFQHNAARLALRLVEGRRPCLQVFPGDLCSFPLVQIINSLVTHTHKKMNVYITWFSFDFTRNTH